MLTLALGIGFLLFTWLLTALLVRQMSRWVKAEKPTFPRALGILLGMLLLSLPFVVAASWLQKHSRTDEPGFLLGATLTLFLVQILLDSLLIGWIVRTSFGKAVLVWLAASVGGAIAVALLYFVMVPYVFESFVVPTNSMAPTVIGWHEGGTCPHCGGELTIPATAPGEKEGYGHREHIGICEKCLKTSNDLPSREQFRLVSPDRIMSNKLVAPRRWDLIIYRTPTDPRVKFLKRLVGLPGESVFIKDGAVWIDGVKQTPPEEIALLEYPATEPDGRPLESMIEENPMKLDAGECCVLGDFLQRSADSRSYGPIPWENIEGVLGLRYYPFGRWKLWR